MGFSLALGVGLTKRGAEGVLELGSLGDWVGGVGAIAAVAVAMWLARKGERERRELREQEAAVVAAYIEGTLCDLAGQIDEVTRLVGEWMEDEQFNAPLPGGLVGSLKALHSGAPVQWFRDNLTKFSVLPNGGGKALAGALFVLERLIADLPKAIACAERPYAYVDRIELDAELENIAGWCDCLTDDLDKAIDAVRMAVDAEPVPLIQLGPIRSTTGPVLG